MVLYYVPFQREKKNSTTSCQRQEEAVVQGQGSQGAAKPGKPQTTAFKFKRSSYTFGDANQRSPENQSLYVQSEGMYAADEGRGIDYKDKMSEQEEISQFVERIFSTFPQSKALTLEQYSHINRFVSSEMFFSLIGLFH